jgi:phospholipid/cholesterol/gamma-HCH transport system substrate-binding protein
VRSKKLMAGVFLIGGFLLFAAGVFLIGSKQKVFSRNYEVYTEFGRLNGLQNGANVQVSGMDAGEVVATQIPESPAGRYRLKLRLQQKFEPLVREDSVASIQTQGLLGNRYVEIDKGTLQTPEAKPGCTIPSAEPFDYKTLRQQGADLLQTTNSAIKDLKTNADQAFEAINKLATDTDGVIRGVSGDLKHITKSGAAITDNVNQLVTSMQSGQGLIGKLIGDPTMGAALGDTMKNVQQSSVNLDQATARVNQMVSQFDPQEALGKAAEAIDNTRQITEQLNEAVKAFLANDQPGENTALMLRDTIKQANQSLANLADDTEALKHNFLVRGFFKKRGFYDLDMNPDQYLKSKFVKGSNTKRAWLSVGELFSRNPDGTEVLTDSGKKHIDSAMGGFVSHLPNRPIMVEGYAASGPPAGRFRVASQRADLVRQHIVEHFGLDLNLIGVMPFTGPPPPGTGRSQWDGVCLVLLNQ